MPIEGAWVPMIDKSDDSQVRVLWCGAHRAVALVSFCERKRVRVKFLVQTSVLKRVTVCPRAPLKPCFNAPVIMRVLGERLDTPIDSERP